MHLISIVGARPQFIKIAPFLRAIQTFNSENTANKIAHTLVHTGQHYDYQMSQVFFDDLGLGSPDYHLGVGSGSHGFQTGEMLKKIEDVIIKEKPNFVIVYGDTNSTLAGALAAAKLHIPVAHVEAGLRSFNRLMPEEINRVLADHVSDILFCPTQTAVDNLCKEGITKGVYIVGDIMYDAAVQYLVLAEKKSTILQDLSLEKGSFVLATVHRAENTDNIERLKNIFIGLESIVENKLPVILPLHPRTRKQLDSASIKNTRVKIINPVSYLDMLILEKNARVILTDSGGVQKEAYFFRVPCVTLRDETEWVETVESGWNTLVGSDPKKIYNTVFNNSKPGKNISLYGDGNTSKKILELLMSQRI